MKGKLLLGYWRTLLGSGQEYPQKYLSTSIHTRVHIHTYTDTGPASRTLLQRRLSLKFISCYKRIQTKTALFPHSCQSHAVNLFQMASDPFSTMPFWSQEACSRQSREQVHRLQKEVFVNIVLNNYVLLLKKKKSTNCVLQTCLAPHLFLHTADLSQSCIHKRQLVGFLPSGTWTCTIDRWVYTNAGWGGPLSVQLPKSQR